MRTHALENRQPNGHSLGHTCARDILQKSRAKSSKRAFHTRHPRSTNRWYFQDDFRECTLQFLPSPLLHMLPGSQPQRRGTQHETLALPCVIRRRAKGPRSVDGRTFVQLSRWQAMKDFSWKVAGFLLRGGQEKRGE